MDDSRLAAVHHAAQTALHVASENERELQEELGAARVEVLEHFEARAQLSSAVDRLRSELAAAAAAVAAPPPRPPSADEAWKEVAAKQATVMRRLADELDDAKTALHHQRGARSHDDSESDVRIAALEARLAESETDEQRARAVSERAVAALRDMAVKQRATQLRVENASLVSSTTLRHYDDVVSPTTAERERDLSLSSENSIAAAFSSHRAVDELHRELGVEIESSQRIVDELGRVVEERSGLVRDLAIEWAYGGIPPRTFEESATIAAQLAEALGAQSSFASTLHKKLGGALADATGAARASAHRARQQLNDTTLRATRDAATLKQRLESTRAEFDVQGERLIAQEHAAARRAASHAEQCAELQRKLRDAMREQQHARATAAALEIDLASASAAVEATRASSLAKIDLLNKELQRAESAEMKRHLSDETALTQREAKRVREAAALEELKIAHAAALVAAAKQGGEAAVEARTSALALAAQAEAAAAVHADKEHAAATEWREHALCSERGLAAAQSHAEEAMRARDKELAAAHLQITQLVATAERTHRREVVSAASGAALSARAAARAAYGSAIDAVAAASVRISVDRSTGVASTLISSVELEGEERKSNDLLLRGVQSVATPDQASSSRGRRRSLPEPQSQPQPPEPEPQSEPQSEPQPQREPRPLGGATNWWDAGWSDAERGGGRFPSPAVANRAPASTAAPIAAVSAAEVDKAYRKSPLPWPAAAIDESRGERKGDGRRRRGRHHHDHRHRSNREDHRQNSSAKNVDYDAPHSTAAQGDGVNDDSSQKLSQNQSHKQSHKLSQKLSQKLPRKARARRPSADLAYASDMSSTVGTPRRVWRKTMPSASRLSEKLAVRQRSTRKKLADRDRVNRASPQARLRQGAPSANIFRSQERTTQGRSSADVWAALEKKARGSPFY